VVKRVENGGKYGETSPKVSQGGGLREEKDLKLLRREKTRRKTGGTPPSAYSQRKEWDQAIGQNLGGNVKDVGKEGSGGGQRTARR